MSNDNRNRFNLEDQDAPEERSSSPASYKDGDDNSPPSGGGGGHDDDSNYNSQEVFEKDKERLIDFLQYPRDKRKLTDFLEDTYKRYEQEAVDRSINRTVHEHKSELQGSTPFHKPGHIGSLMYEYLNMIGVEAAFVSGLQHTKSSMTKTVQQRVDEINTLLRGVGGFNRQIKASFSRSAAVYLEQEDPRNKHREKVVFTVNLADFELRYPLDEAAGTELVEDGRSLRRFVWDEAVNTLAEIVSNTGMKPKYVKNDKNSCVFTMRQYLLADSTDNMPDEYFTFDLRHMSPELREKMTKEYVEQIAKWDEEIADCKAKLESWWVGGRKKAIIRDQLKLAEASKSFFIGTTADPREMDTGLVFSIAVNTLKDYTVTKDKMQVIMTKYILALSRIAVDKSMDQQVNTVYQQRQAKARNFQQMDEELSEGGEAENGNGHGNGRKVVVVKDDLVRRKKAAGRFRP
jgi:hypothetical protein